jgi:hypothetical protein
MENTHKQYTNVATLNLEGKDSAKGEVFRLSYLTFETNKGNNFLLEIGEVGSATAHFSVSDARKIIQFLTEKSVRFTGKAAQGD